MAAENIAAVSGSTFSNELAPEPDPPTAATTLSTIAALKLAFTYRRFIPTILRTTASFYFGSGPAEVSWPIEIALFVELCRHASQSKGKQTLPPGAAAAAPLDPVAIIQRFRSVARIEKILPPPKNGFATQVQIVVPSGKSVLKGVLAGLEDGEEKTERIIKAEWVVHNSLAALDHVSSNHVVLYFHGGGYALMSPASHRPLVIALSQAMNARVFSVDYRLAPEDPFPSALQDAVESYFYLLELGIPASNIIVSGDSAGGGLSIALLLYLRDHYSDRQIGGAILLSPWTDLTSSCHSWVSNKHLDYLAGADDDDKTIDLAHLYVGGPEKYEELIIHPYVTSAVADLSHLPPLLIQSGASEVLRDEITLFAERAFFAGVRVEYHVLAGGIHVPQAFVHTELARAAIEGMSHWLLRQPPAVQFDFSTIDRLIRSNAKPYSPKAASHPSASLSASTPARRHTPFTYTLVDQRAPLVTLREAAHPAIRRAVEENERMGIPRVGMTKLLRADRMKAGVWERARGVFHL